MYRVRRSLALGVVAAAVVSSLAVPATASSGTTQIGGTGAFHAVYPAAFTADCPEPAGYGNFDAITLELNSGNLRGCWYTLVEAWRFSPDADASPVVYQERGREVFVGAWYDDAGALIGEGTFETTYKFTSKYEDASLAVEIHGRCQHPIAEGTGTGVFAGATGRVDFKDDVDTGVLTYRGHISRP